MDYGCLAKGLPLLCEVVFSQQTKEVFGLYLNNLFGVFARVWKIKKRFFLVEDFDPTSSSLFLVFPKRFSL